MHQATDITLLEQLRALPPDRQQLASAYLHELLEELARPEGTVRLSDEEQAILSLELEGAKHGDLASDAEVADVLGKPWR